LHSNLKHIMGYDLINSLLIFFFVIIKLFKLISKELFNHMYLMIINMFLIISF